MNRRSAACRHRSLLVVLFAVFFLGFTSTLRAQISFVADLGASEGFGFPPASLSITTTASVPAGGSIIVVAVDDGADTNSLSSSSVSVSDSAGHSYTTDVSIGASLPPNNAFSTISSTHQIPTALPAGSTITITWSGGVGGQLIRARAFAVTGLASTPLDKTAFQSGHSTSPSSGTAGMTSQASELLVGAISDNQSGVSVAGFSPGSGYTALAGVGTSGPSLYAEYQIVSATGAYAATGTFAVDDLWNALLATYRAACTVTCPANQTANTGPGATDCCATVNYPDPTVASSCGAVACSPPSGSCYPVGTTTVTCGTVQDGPSCTFTITVNDTTPPVITCPMNQTLSANANCQAVATYSATATDNCTASPGVTCTPPSGSAFTKGTTTVTCTATDGAGNTAMCTFNVTVNDTQPPSITCPANKTAKTATINDPCAAVTFPPPTASDNCPGATTVCNPASGSCFAVGTTTVNCTATDASGNTATCSFTVTVFNVCLQDDSNPSIVFLGNTISGAYRFCCGVAVFTGVAQVTRRGNVASFQHNPADRRVQATDDEGVFKGTASLQSPPGTTRCTITDRDTRNNGCVCQ